MTRCFVQWMVLVVLVCCAGGLCADEFIPPAWAKDYKAVVQYDYERYNILINGQETNQSVEVQLEAKRTLKFADKNFVLQTKGLKHRKKLLQLLNKTFKIDNRYLCRLQEGVCQMPPESKIAVSVDKKKQKLYLFLPKQFGISREYSQSGTKVWINSPKTHHLVMKQNLNVSPLIANDNNDLNNQLLVNLEGNASEGNQYFYYSGIGNLSNQNNSQQNFRLNQMAYGRYDGFFDTELGLVGGGGGVFVRGQQVWGVDIEKSDAIVSQRSRALVDQNPVTITLEQESVVKVYDGDQLLSTQILAPGIQNLRTSGFPPINGTLRIDIFDANERLIRTIYRDFNNRGALPSALFDEWRISAGVIEQNGRDFIQLNHNQRVFADHAGWLNSLNLYQSHPYFESSLAYVNYFNIAPTLFVDPQNAVTGWGLRLNGGLPKLFSYSVNWRDTGGYIYPQDSAIINGGFSVNLRRNIRLPRGFDVDVFSEWNQAALVNTGYDQTLRASIRKNVTWDRYLFTYGLTLSSTAFAAKANTVASGQRENGIFFTLNINKIISEYPNSNLNFDVRSNENGLELPNLRYTKDSLPDDERPWRQSQWQVSANTQNQTVGYSRRRHTYSSNIRVLRGADRLTLSANYTTSWVFSPYGTRQIADQVMTGYGVYADVRRYNKWVIGNEATLIPHNGFDFLNNYNLPPRIYSIKENVLPVGAPKKRAYLFPHLIEVLPPLSLVREYRAKFKVVNHEGKPMLYASVISPKPCVSCVSATDNRGMVDLAFSSARPGDYVVYPSEGMPCRIQASTLLKRKSRVITCEPFDF